VTDSCGPTAVSRLHSEFLTDTTRHASHSHISRHSPLDYWGSPQGTPLPGVRMRLVTFVISVAGAISPDAQGLLAAVSRCSGGSLPSSLYPLSSWSASRLIPYVRQAVTFSVRRHLAAYVFVMLIVVLSLLTNRNTGSLLLVLLLLNSLVLLLLFNTVVHVFCWHSTKIAVGSCTCR
jgi:hypothetical protein